MVEINEAERKKEKRIKRNEDNLRDLWDNVKRPNIRIIRVPEEEDKKKGHEKLLEEIIAENFPKMGKEIATQVQETQRVPNRINPRGDTFILDLDLLFHRSAFVKGETEPSLLSLLQPLRTPACISLLPKGVQGATGLCFSAWGNGLRLLSQSFFDFPCLTVAAAVSGEHPVYPVVSALSLDSQNAALG